VVDRYLLDTDRIIDALHGIPEAIDTLAGLAAAGVRRQSDFVWRAL
jgi:hypothetical protein